MENKPEAANVETAHNIEHKNEPAPFVPTHPGHFPVTPEILRVQITLPQNDSMPEGESRLKMRLTKVFFKDLSLREKIRTIPLLGYVLAWVNALVKLPVTRHHHQVEIDLLQRKLALNEEKIIHVNARLGAAQVYIDARVDHVNHEINCKIDAIRDALERRIHAQEKIDASSRLREIESIRSASRLHEIESVRSAPRLHAMDMLDIGTRLMKLEQIESARKLKHYARLLQLAQKESIELKNQVDRLSLRIAQIGASDDLSDAGESCVQVEVTNNHSVHIDSVKKASFDQFFSDFEDVFRGEKAEIKRRLEVYLPYVREGMADPSAAPDFHIVDVGCGRGEWLELMADQGMSALGIDLNEHKVKACIDAGLAAKTMNAIAYLREQPAGSLSVVTGFHIIEHLPFDQLIALFDAAFSALKQGGLLIFETPNPENLLVGACNFYFDPTHLSPIVPAVAQFMASQRGFSHADILRLHPYPDDHLAHGDTEVDHIVNRYLFGAQDYALIARK